MADSVVVRPATIKDAPRILQFVKDLARYEKAEDEVLATVADVEATLFCHQPKVWGLIAELNGEAVGFAVYFFNYSTWQGKHGLYLEDVYVDPEYRRFGVGRIILQRLAQIAVSNNCGRFEWSVLDWNTPAIEFYRSIAAKPKDEWVGYQLAGEALRRLAENNNR